jgi:hypothetical protein
MTHDTSTFARLDAHAAGRAPVSASPVVRPLILGEPIQRAERPAATDRADAIDRGGCMTSMLPGSRPA